MTLDTLATGYCPGCPECPTEDQIGLAEDEGYISHFPCDMCGDDLQGLRYAAHAIDRALSAQEGVNDMKDITRKRLRKLHYPFLGYAEHCSLCYEMAHDWDDEVEYRHPDDPYYTTVDECDLCGDRSAGIRWVGHAHDCHRFDPVHLVLCEKCADIVQDIQDQRSA